MAALGAVIIDADEITRELQTPGTEVFNAMVERFGPQIVANDGTLNRPAVATIVFSDANELEALNRIVHPAVGAEIERQLRQSIDSQRVVILDIPLLAEGRKGRYPIAATIVVDVDEDLAVDRLVTQRGFSAEDARARMSRQASRSERLALADRVIDNSGDLADLEKQVEELFQWAQGLSSLEQTNE